MCPAGDVERPAVRGCRERLLRYARRQRAESPSASPVRPGSGHSRCAGTGGARRWLRRRPALGA